MRERVQQHMNVERIMQYVPIVFVTYRLAIYTWSHIL